MLSLIPNCNQDKMAFFRLLHRIVPSRHLFFNQPQHLHHIRSNRINQTRPYSLVVHQLRQIKTGLDPEVKEKFDFDQIGQQSALPILSSCELYHDFIGEKEEKSLLKQVDKFIARRRYEDSHWDYAILQFREIECQSWTDDNQKGIDRIRAQTFRPDHPSLTEYKPSHELPDKPFINVEMKYLDQTNQFSKEIRSKEKGECRFFVDVCL